MQLLVRIKSHFSLNIINTDLSNQDLFNRGTVKMSKIIETKYSRMGQVKMVRLGRPYHFLKAVSTNFTWSILEYFVPFVVSRQLLNLHNRKQQQLQHLN